MSRVDGVKVTGVKGPASAFGGRFDMEALRREDGKYPEQVVVAVQRHGFKPVSLLLPHQLYVEEAERLLREHGASEIWVYPIYDTGLWTQVDLESGRNTDGDARD